MSNSFSISVKPEIAALKADTADIRTDVTAIHDTALPAVKTETGYILTGVTSIHDVLLPAIDGKLDTNLAAIIAKTIRGDVTFAYLDTTNFTDYQTIVDIAGSGKLISLQGMCINAGDTFSLELIIDGLQFYKDITTDLTWTGSALGHSIEIYPYFNTSDINAQYHNALILNKLLTDTIDGLINIEFNTSLSVKIKKTVLGEAGYIHGKVIYQLN